MRRETTPNNTSYEFECQRCGWCCKNVNINISYSDILRWSKERRIDLLNQVNYIDHEDPKKKGFYFIKTVQAPKQPCPYLTMKDDLAVCSIHETKPRACKEFPCAHIKDEKQKIKCPAQKDHEPDKKTLFKFKEDQSLDFRLAEDRKDQLLEILEKTRQITTLLGEIKEFGDDPTEDLWVNGLGTERTAWTEVGTTPFLSVQDQPTNYIWTTTKKAEHGDFTFADHVEGSGIINSVTLYVYCQNTTGRTLGFWIWDGTIWTDYQVVLPTTWTWINVAVPVLDSWEKIDGAKLYIMQPVSDIRSDIDAAYLLVDYTSEATGYEDRSLSLEVELAGITGYEDRSLSLEVELTDYADRNFTLEVELTGYADRSLSLDINYLGYEDLSLSLDIELTDFEDRSLTLEIELTGYEDRSFSLEVELTDYEDRNLILEVELTSYEDRNLSLDINYLGYADRNFSLDINFLGYEDRNLVLDVEPVGLTGYEDRSLTIEIAGWGYTDRSFSLEIEQTGYLDRDLSLDVNYLGYEDRSLSLEIEFIGYEDRNTILDIEQTAYEDRDFSLEVEFITYEDRSLSLEVELTGFEDRSLELSVNYQGYEDRSLSLDLILTGFEDRSLVLDAEVIYFETGYKDQSLYLNVHRRKVKITSEKISYHGVIVKE